jgi:hypothetical protein
MHLMGGGAGSQVILAPQKPPGLWWRYLACMGVCAQTRHAGVYIVCQLHNLVFAS